MAEVQPVCLRWKKHQNIVISMFDTFLTSGQLVDCTLAAEGQFVKAHKVVLSACSPFFEVLLSQHYEKHPIIILNDVKFQQLKSMIDYMYKGEVNIGHDQLETFIQAAESLQIKGLFEGGEKNDFRDISSTNSQMEGPTKSNSKVSLRSSESRSPETMFQSEIETGFIIEPRKSHAHPSREGSVSPVPRKRRRQRKSIHGDNNQLSSDHHIDNINLCDLPSQAQSTTSVPRIPSIMTSVVPVSAVSSNVNKLIKSEQTLLETGHLNANVALDTEIIKQEIEPISEILIKMKTEDLDEVKSEECGEDFNLDDDDDLDLTNNTKLSHDSNQTDFIKDLVVHVVEQRGFEFEQQAPGPSTSLSRLSARHFASKIPPTAKKDNPTRRCKVCSEKGKHHGGKVRKETRFYCSECDVALCFPDCFTNFHTKELYTV